MKDYGKTNDLTFSAGIQYSTRFPFSALIFGIEDNGEFLKDRKMGYPDYQNAIIVNDSIISIPHTANTTIAEQQTNTIGTFAQYEITYDKTKLSAGIRYDHYQITDVQNTTGNCSGDVFSPRLTFKYDIKDFLQTRLSYAQGYRAPQIYNEDLHIETSGSRKVLHKNSPDLKQETSRSYTVSFDFNKALGRSYFGLLIEGFYTKLLNPFVSQYRAPDENGIVIYLRRNASNGAIVSGFNLELNFIPSNIFTIKSGFTLQSSQYEKTQDFNERRFLKTPDDYGYLTIDYKPKKDMAISATANYTGNMLVPYFGQDAINPDTGELHQSGNFLDIGLKGRYNMKLNGASVQLFAGIKNLFNSYQNDFDKGINRDPGYIYGPSSPRTFYFGIKIGNNINK
jgi:outer membrane receptor for ferrienterochelin and colicins